MLATITEKIIPMFGFFLFRRFMGKSEWFVKKAAFCENMVPLLVLAKINSLQKEQSEDFVLSVLLFPSIILSLASLSYAFLSILSRQQMHIRVFFAKLILKKLL